MQNVMYQVNFASGTPSEANPLPVSATNVTVKPSETYEDPVGKFRMSQPQSLIDTDFEYSTQPQKWEVLNLVQNRPSFFPKGTGGNSIDITSATFNGGAQSPYSIITVTTTVAHGFVVGDVITVIETTSVFANGTFIVATVPTGTSFTYISRGVVSGAVFDATQTVVYGGGIYEGSNIPITSASSSGAAQSVITLTTTTAHGLLPGTPILINNSSATGINGRWVITQVASPTTFVFTVATLVTAGAITLGSAVLYVSAEGTVQHRSTDGGVAITTQTNTPGPSVIRQTRRYFRYQSGKGIQYSTGVKFTPTHDVDAITASGTTATITTQQNHNFQPGCTINVDGVTIVTGTAGTNPYNGTFTVATVTGVKSFTYTMSTTPSDLAPITSHTYVTCTGWVGAAVRCGMYDDQNGFFFEYNGSTLCVVRRESTKELAGRIAVNANSQVVTGTSTKFRSQLLVQDHIVIRGHTYEIVSIASDTSMTVSPAFRGSVNITNARFLKTQNYRIPQSEWNLDTCDGTGPSGYTLNIKFMQMCFIDYSWYGAGTIRWGFRTTNGALTYVHKLPMNNVNYAAYMRSGNLPGRFEVENYGQFSRLVAGATGVRGAALGSADTIMYVENVQFWPPTGYIFVQDGTNCELIGYSAIGAYNATAQAYPLSGLTRRTSYTLAGINVLGTFSNTAYTIGGGTGTYTFTPDATVGGAGTAAVSVQQEYNNCAPWVSHWGVSVVMDGRYDDDKNVLLVAGMQRNLIIPAGTQRPLLAIRIAPSVDSAIANNFGVRELVNRMQLTLRGVGVSSQGQFLIEGVLNPSSLAGTGITFPTSWTTLKVGSGSLAQVVYWDGTGVYNTAAAASTGTLVGGDRIFGFYTENSGGTNYSVTSVNLEDVRDLGTSILSGNGNATSPCYPNGPDVLVITARNLESTGNKNIACRISWTEAQA